ncbi:MAG TPA: GNAT family N-acetyltransferase [Prolixibacteraceae bacterium]|nr:GNAT family N-acetyltransferase [Prolixibacteraceae bacterium]
MELSFAHFKYTENLAQQRDLFKDCFPETKGEVIQEEIYYSWKFHSFPNVAHSYEYACYSDTDMVGYYAALPYRYKIGEKITSVGMVCDVMTSSKHRGKGIFTKMGAYSTNELASKVPFTMGYPIRKEVIPGHLKVGWKVPFSLPLYMKFIRLNTILKSKKIGFLAPLANVSIRLYNSLRKTKLNKTYSFALTTNIKDVKGYEAFAKEWNESIPNALIKDMPFSKWRYGAPGRNYQFLSIYNYEGLMIGFVSFRSIIKEEVPSYGILDYMVLPGFADCHGLINKVLTDRAKKENVEAIMTMMSKNSASEYQLCNNGFFKSPFVFQLIIKNLTKEYSDEDLFNENNWHLMWVDSDDL